MRIVWNFKSIWVVAVVLFYFKKEWNDINKATADFMLEQPWLRLFFYPYKRDCSADYVEQTEYDSDSENIRTYENKDELKNEMDSIPYALFLYWKI